MTASASTAFGTNVPYDGALPMTPIVATLSAAEERALDLASPDNTLWVG